MTVALQLFDVGKTFVMHLQGGVRIPVVSGATFCVRSGECVVLSGPSGAGKSSILKMVFGSYRCDRGQILVRGNGREVDVAVSGPRAILDLRRNVIGYVTQFLRAVPRVAAIDVVAEPLVLTGTARDVARRRAAEMLRRLQIPGPLWGLPPATFSGGEQQRINIARGFLPDLPILLLDEPTASLDTANRAIVADLVAEKKQRGVAIVAIVHDEDIRNIIADTVVDVSRFTVAARGMQ